MRINNNLMAMNTLRQLGINNNNMSKSIEKLSSGNRINRAGDDAAGLAISEKMRGQIRGLNQASRNAQDGISMIQTAEGALQETQAILQRMRELAVQSSSDTLVETDREKIQLEVDQLATEITRISNNTEFNTQNLLNGGLTSDTDNGRDITFHIGANKGQDLTFGISAMDAKTLGVAGDKTSGTVQAGATDVTGVTVTGNAAAVTDGNTITVSATSDLGGTVATGSTGIDSATATLGGAVVDGASIDISVAVDNAAEAATITGNSAAATTDLTGISADAKLTITVDGTAYDLDQAALQGATGVGKTIGDLINAINTAVGSSVAAEGTGADSGKIVLTSGTTGSTSNISVSITGTTTTNIDTAFGLSDGLNDIGSDADYAVTFNDGTTSVTVNNVAGNAATVTGSGVYSTLSFETGGFIDENTAGTINIDTTYTVTLSDGTNTDSVITGLTGTETSISGTGDFAGFTLTTDGAFDENLAATIDVTSSQSTAATIAADGTVTEATVVKGIDVSTRTAANNAIETINNAINTVSEERSKLGAYQNRLEHTIKNLDTSSENLQSAESRIRDVDMAKEMMEQSKNSILSQAAQAMLAQAKQAPQGVLQLLR